jgi:hypothetical protein
MRTSIGMFALVGFLSAFNGTASAQDVVWKKTYSEARDHGQKVNKPLAVFVGTGANGFQKIIEEGSFSSDIRKIIAKEYIPVYLDADLAENQQLLKELGIASRKGLILSDRECGSQAFFHDGALSETELTRQLWRFADPSIVVRSTATTSSNARYSFYQAQSQFAAPATSSRNC